MSRLWFILILLVSISPKLFSQDNQYTDSLRNQLKLSANPHDSADLFNKLSEYYIGKSDSKNGIIYADEALNISKRINDKSLIVSSLLNLGSSNNLFLNSTGAALLYFDDALKLAVEIEDSVKIAQCYVGLSFAHYDITKDYSLALTYAQKAIDFAEMLNLNRMKADSYMSLALIYDKMGESERGRDYLLRTLKLNQLLNDLNWIAYIYNKLGESYLNDGRLESAENAYTNSLFNYRKLGANAPDYSIPWTVGGISHVEMQKAAISLERGDTIKAKALYSKADSLVRLRISIEDSLDLPHSASALDQAKIYLRLSEIDTRTQRPAYRKFALNALRLSISEAREYKEIDVELLAYEPLYKLYQSEQKYDSAFFALLNFKQLNDSLNKQEFVNQLIRADVTSQYKMREQEKSKELLLKESRQKTILLIISLSLAFALLILFLILRQNKRIAKQKRKSDDLLLNILPGQTAEELKQFGRTATKKYENVSIVFTDFVGFTSIAESLSPEELVHEINKCFCEFDYIVTSFGLEKIKTIGDSYMFAGGIPKENDRHAKDCVRASMEIIKAIEAYNNLRKNEGKPQFHIRIGINSGPVVAGVVGVKKFQYDIWGDSVNTASRMESSGEAGKINISSATYKQICNDPEFQFVSRGKLVAKGKGEIEMYFVSMQ
ncbi:MAG: adenylate/guanylate cyclase domain-containing protein [Bacteroidia bacterium]